MNVNARIASMYRSVRLIRFRLYGLSLAYLCELRHSTPSVVFWERLLYAVDFVCILVNLHKFKYQVSLAASFVVAEKRTPIPGATVTAALESASPINMENASIRSEWRC